jgi:hypothetical protein
MTRHEPSRSSWTRAGKSPITSDLIVAQSIILSDVCLDGGNIHWLEGRPQEQGRNVVVRADANGQQMANCSASATSLGHLKDGGTLHHSRRGRVHDRDGEAATGPPTLATSRQAHSLKIRRDGRSAGP